jgi:hypothetical protein
MGLIVIRPVLLAAVYRYAAIRALKVDVRGRGAGFRRLAAFEVVRIVRCTRRLVRGMWAVSVLSHKGSALANLGYGRVRERVEEVVLGEDKLSLDALRIDIVYRLEGSFKLAAWSRGYPSSRQRELGLGRNFGGVVARSKCLGGDAERRRGPQLGARGFDERETLVASIRRPHDGRLASGKEGAYLRKLSHMRRSFTMLAVAKPLAEERWSVPGLTRRRCVVL